MRFASQSPWVLALGLLMLLASSSVLLHWLLDWLLAEVP
jgi:hypothetical protein